jgi:hypothetical protein
MKKKLTLAVCLFGTMAYAQVGRAGINTSTPKTTLDVNGKTDTSGNLLSTDLTGLQAPRLTRTELTAKGNTLYGTDQKGALVYITDISGGDAVSQRVNVSAIGYYYFDGALWQKMAGSIAGADIPVTPKLISVAERSTSLSQIGGAISWNGSVYNPGNELPPLPFTNYIIKKAGLHQIFVNATAITNNMAIGAPWYLRILKNNTPIAAVDATKAAGASSVVFAIDFFNVNDKITVDYGGGPDGMTQKLTRLTVFRFE